jgi:hypothetical protein
VAGQPFPAWTASVLAELPALVGEPLRLDVRPRLTAAAGRLLSNQPGRGHAVFAASFIRRREIVLEAGLMAETKLLRGILLHELFHFAWVRSSNADRRNYAALLSEELNKRARGEMGESSQVSKVRLGKGSDSAGWTNYVCESFCDTAACLFSPDEVWQTSLAARWRDRRSAWFEAWVARREWIRV